jgi:hypothetical protein
MRMRYKKHIRKDECEGEESEELTRFTFPFRAYRFVLAQTEGGEMNAVSITDGQVSLDCHS